LYASADLTVIASREDNLPNVILESLCCGTPVVGTPAGGIAEPVVMNRDGMIASSTSAGDLATALNVAARTSFSRELIADCAARRYSQRISADRYSALYQSISAAVYSYK
jgi:glycosyltransferase involved in cell wall biosynthesis